MTAPPYNQNTGGYGSNPAPSPVSKALSNFSMGAPQTAVKTQSVTHPDGTKVDTTYHPPATEAKQGQSFTDTQGNQVSASQNKFDPMTGKAYGSSPNSGVLSGTAETSQERQAINQQTKYGGNYDPNNPNPPPTYGGLIGQGATASGNAAKTGSANYDTANTGLLNATAGNQQYADRDLKFLPVLEHQYPLR